MQFNAIYEMFAMIFLSACPSFHDSWNGTSCFQKPILYSHNDGCWYTLVDHFIRCWRTIYCKSYQIISYIDTLNKFNVTPVCSWIFFCWKPTTSTDQIIPSYKVRVNEHANEIPACTIRVCNGIIHMHRSYQFPIPPAPKIIRNQQHVHTRRRKVDCIRPPSSTCTAVIK